MEQAEIDKLIQENAQLKGVIAEGVNREKSVDDMLEGIKKDYTFFRSQIPNCSMPLGDGSVIAFELNTRVLERDPRTGRTLSEESWGQYYTKSPEVARELLAACKTSNHIRLMTHEEVEHVLESVRSSYIVNE